MSARCRRACALGWVALLCAAACGPATGSGGQVEPLPTGPGADAAAEPQPDAAARTEPLPPEATPSANALPPEVLLSADEVRGGQGEAPLVGVVDLGPVGTPPDCDVAPLLAALGSRCEAIPALGVEASGVVGAWDAFDTDACDLWNSGGAAPQVAGALLAVDRPVSGLLLVPEMSPGGTAAHVIETSQHGATFVPQAKVRVAMESARAYAFVLPTPIEEPRFRVRTVESPSWVAWRAIVPFTCDGPVAPSGTALEPVPDPPPPAEWVYEPGEGSCGRDGDCVNEDCCAMEITCVSRRRAPDCPENHTCPAMITPFQQREGACVCREGHCATRLRPENYRGRRSVSPR